MLHYNFALAPYFYKTPLTTATTARHHLPTPPTLASHKPQATNHQPGFFFFHKKEGTSGLDIPAMAKTSGLDVPTMAKALGQDDLAMVGTFRPDVPSNLY